MHTDHNTLSTFDSDKSSQTSTKLFDRKRRLLICSLNALSLLKHKSEIEMLLRDNKIDILALNEIKIDEIVDDSLISIDGYFHERHDRNRHGGGVLIYIKDTITSERLQNDDTKLCDLETITIQVKPKCAKPFVIIAWYRPPNHKIDDILNIKKVYKTFDKTETEVIILGDVNCDDLPDQDKNSIVAKLRGFYKQYQFRQLIKHPTRTTDKFSTLLDHFATNKSNFITLSGSKYIGFSDHDLVFGICKISGSMQKEPKIVNCRNTQHYTPEIFRKALSEVSWEHILTAMDPNTMSELWLDQFTDILDQIASLKQRKVKNSYAAYIDKDLRQTMLLQDFYKKKHARFKDPSDWSAYKKLRNEASSKI